MKKSWSFVSLMAALVVGSASAAGTTAGTTITNVASISFIPEGAPPNTPPTDVPSNPVNTKVLPVPSFTITPNDEGPAGPTFPTQNNTLTQTLRPGDTAVFLYTLTNTGNVPQENYDLTTQTGGAPAPTDVRYYPVAADTNNDGTLSSVEITASTPITTITGVDPDQSKKFFQVYTVPTTATDGNTLGADPVGTRKPNGAPGTDREPAAPFTQPVDNDNFNTVTVKRQDAGVIGPKADPDGNGTPTTPAYPSTDPTPVTVTPTAVDTQVAQATVTTNQITFTNTIQNNGNRPDVFDITTVSQNFPPNSTVVLYTLNPDGTKGPVLPDTDGDGVPDTGSIAPGGTKDILVEVKFPAGTPAPTPGQQPTVVVTATSSNDPSKSDTTKDIVNLPGVVFGDVPVDPANPNPTPNPTPVVPAKPATPDPKDPTAVSVDPLTCVTTTNAFLAVGVKNLGTAPDSFVIAGTTTINLVSGSTRAVTVTYYKDVNGNGIQDTGDTILPSVTGGQDTGSINPGDTLKLVAVIPVPCDAAQGTYTINQTAKSPTTGVTGTDPNDTVKVGGNGQTPNVAKTGPATAKPGEVLTYTIVGKNTSNANVTKAFVKDTVPANTTFSAPNASWTATSTATGTVLYSTNGTTWSAVAPTAPQADGTTFYAGVDTNGDGNITTADILKPGESITATFKVVVK